MKGHAWLLLVLVLWCTAATGQTSPPAIIEKVAHAGDPAPGIPDFTLDFFVTPEIDGAGNVLFFAFLDGPGVQVGNGRAIFYGTPGNIQKLVYESEQVPDMPEGVIISDLFGAGEGIAEDSGWIELTLTMTGPGIVEDVNDRAYFVGPPDDIRKVLQGGDQAPGCETGVYIDCEASSGFGGFPSDNGQLLVVADLAGPGVTSLNDRAWWLGTRDNLELVYRERMQAPGFDPGVMIDWVDCQAHTDAGIIIFRGGLWGPGVTGDNDLTRWVGGPGTLQMIAREGDPVPGMEPGITWSTVAGGLSTINAFGDLAEVGILQGPGVTADNDYVLFTGNADGLQLVAREGDPAPEAGPGAFFRAFSMPWVNNRSEVFYVVKYAGTGVDESNEWAMYYGPLEGAELTLRDGEPAPTFPEGVALWAVGGVPANCAMNDVGDIIAPTEIKGPGITADNKVVLWFRHGILERWIPLLRAGMTIDGRTVLATSCYDFGGRYWNQTGGADGRYQSMNDLGMLAINLKFTDGTEGIYRISPPVFGDANCDGVLDGRDIAPFTLAIVDRAAYEGQCPDCDAEAYCDLNGDGEIDSEDIPLFVALLTNR